LRLLADDERQLRDEIDHELPIRAERLEQDGAPLTHLLVALSEDPMDQTLKRLGQRRIGNIALVLIELAGSEQSTRRDQFLMELIYERGLPNAGVSGYDDQLGRAAGDDPLEGREQGAHFALPPI